MLVVMQCEDSTSVFVFSQALWLHRRFLALCWMRHLNQNDPQASVSDNIRMFLNKELHLVKSCMNIPDNLYEDFQAQALHSITYILWLIKVNSYLFVPYLPMEFKFNPRLHGGLRFSFYLNQQFPEFQSNEFEEKLKTEEMKDLLKTIYPERSFIHLH